jgi:hypothetical protein
VFLVAAGVTAFGSLRALAMPDRQLRDMAQTAGIEGHVSSPRADDLAVQVIPRALELADTTPDLT